MPVASAPRIHVLPSELINQIAAGEVVERPASVVKELVENAIDAGATAIDIVLEDGGKKLIEVADNGCGMSADDAARALERHATSKIRAFDDLLSVATLGFRGEALPSIASVSRFTLLTSEGSGVDGIEIHCEPSLPPFVRPAARDRGTTVRVRDLFENVPARRKFLKSADAEYRSVAAIVTSYALPSPQRSFRLSHNGRVVLDLPAAPDGRERAIQVLGRDAGPALVPLDCEVNGCRAGGFVTRGLRFGSRRNQYFFVNGRLVKDRVLTHAATRAADAFDFDGHPAIILFLETDRTTVDVNVHPAKTEVRFRDSGLVHVVVEQAVKTALGGPGEGSALLRERATEPGDDAAASVPGAGFAPVPLPGAFAPIRNEVAYEHTPLFQQKPVVQPPVLEALPDLGDLRGRVIGQYRASYILVDAPEGLRLVDQHVAHERVLYDRIAARVGQSPESQQMLTPLVYETGAAEAAILASLLDELRSVGFEIEPFSRNSFAVSSIPAILGRDTVEGFFRKLIDASADEKGSHLAKVRDRVIASLACQAAIKVHRPLSGAEMSQLIADLLVSSNPYACPHGRPIIVDIRHVDVEKHFHRR